MQERLSRYRPAWRMFFAFCAGVLANLAMPPLNFVALFWLAFPVLLWLEECNKSRKAAFLTGWLFGFGYFFMGLYWISFALLTDIESYWFLIPFAMAGLPAGLAVFTGLVMLCLHISPLKGIARIFLFAGLFGAAEWLRGHVLTGFPWNLTGYGWSGSLAVLQSTSVIGIYGLGILTVLAASIPALLCHRKARTPLTFGLTAFGVLVFAGLWGWGHQRLAKANDETVPGIGLRIVQPNIIQTEKWDPKFRVRNFQRLITLSGAPATDKQPITHIIWPETATAWFISELEAARETMTSIIPPGGFLLTGQLRQEAAPDGEPAPYFNSLSVMDHSGRFIAHADKSHLVPFGEYIPLRKYLPFDPVAAGAADFAPGDGPLNLHIQDTPPFSPLICYEVIFPGDVVQQKADRPEWLLNVTNDAWYGHTAGPHQHLAIARIRSIEEGMPLVRAANTGISAVFDSWGRNTGLLGLGRQGVVDTPLPKALPTPPHYAVNGDLTFFVLLSGCFMLSIMGGLIRQYKFKSL